MGYFSLDGHEAEFDDRTLAHIHIVIINKLRHAHSFAFSWKEQESAGGGRTSVWLHPGSNVRFSFSETATPSLNRLWLQQLAECAESSRGLVVLPEPRTAPIGTTPRRPENARQIDEPPQEYART